MKIATWNVNGLLKRLDLVLAWLAATRPDVVALQETKVRERDFPKAALAAAGYDAMSACQPTWNGVALLARDAEIVPIRHALPGDPDRDVDDRQARYVEAAIRGIVFASIYLPNGNPQPGPKFDYKLAWFERLIAHAQGLHDSGHPVALIGDFNVIPTALDLYDTRSYDDNALLQPATRAAWERLVAQGWIDALRAKHPGESIYTFWDYLRNRWPRNAGLRIDHLLLSPPLAKRLEKADVDRSFRGVEGASDHAPVWITLKEEAQR